MAGKPRVTVRLESSIVAVLDWYAAARAIPPAELAAELIGAGVLEALVDADLRALVTEQAGPPPAVPLAAGAFQQRAGGPQLATALAELRALGEDLVASDPALGARIQLAAQQVEGHAILLREAFASSARRHGAARNGASTQEAAL
jgi:hypothetical protein